MGLYDNEVKRYPINLPKDLYDRFSRECKRAYKKRSEVMRDLILKFCLISETCDIYPEVRTNDRIEDTAGGIVKTYRGLKEKWFWRKNG